MVRIVNAPSYGAGSINIGNPGEFTMLDLGEKVPKLMGSTFRLAPRRPLPLNDPKQRQQNVSLAVAKLGLRPEEDQEDGLTETIAHFCKTLELG